MTNEVVRLRSSDYELRFYDSGCKSLAEAATTDEVKDIIDKSVAVQAYARQINNLKLSADAAVIFNRAEQKMGKLMNDLRREGSLAQSGQQDRARRRDSVSEGHTIQTIEDIGISRKQAARCIRLASMGESTFESRLRRMRQNIEEGTSQVTRIQPPSPPRDPPSIDKVVSKAWHHWDNILEGDEMEKLKEISNHRRHAEQAGIDHLAQSLEKISAELNRIIRRLRS
jgi:hypothetical protein